MSDLNQIPQYQARNPGDSSSSESPYNENPNRAPLAESRASSPTKLTTKTYLEGSPYIESQISGASRNPTESTSSEPSPSESSRFPMPLPKPFPREIDLSIHLQASESSHSNATLALAMPSKESVDHVIVSKNPAFSPSIPPSAASPARMPSHNTTNLEGYSVVVESNANLGDGSSHDTPSTERVSRSPGGALRGGPLLSLGGGRIKRYKL
jgi:hypothetical protein